MIIEKWRFRLTAEYCKAETEDRSIKAALHSAERSAFSVNVADILSEWQIQLGCIGYPSPNRGSTRFTQVVTRDKKPYRHQSDLAGCGSFGIRNILCLSGYHQTLTDSSESAECIDLDIYGSCSNLKKMREQGNFER